MFVLYLRFITDKKEKYSFVKIIMNKTCNIHEILLVTKLNFCSNLNATGTKNYWVFVTLSVECSISYNEALFAEIM